MPMCRCDLSRAGFSNGGPSLSPWSAHYTEWSLKTVTQKKKKKSVSTPTQPQIHTHTWQPYPSHPLFLFPCFFYLICKLFIFDLYFFFLSPCVRQTTRTLSLLHAHKDWVILGFNVPLRLIHINCFQLLKEKQRDCEKYTSERKRRDMNKQERPSLSPQQCYP